MQRNYNQLLEYLGGNEVVSELANASYGLTFVQLHSGNANEAPSTLLRFLSREVRTVKLYAAYTKVLCESGAVCSVMSSNSAKTLRINQQTPITVYPYSTGNEELLSVEWLSMSRYPLKTSLSP